MISMVNKLIDDGETERASIQANRDAAEADYNTNEQARLDAAAAHGEATTALFDGQAALADQKLVRDAAKVTYEASKLALNNA